MKKIKNLIIIFLMVMVFGIPNVYAETAMVDTTEELYSALSNSNVDVIKLDANILYNDSTDKMVYSASKTKVLDLNGYTLSSDATISLRVTDSTPYDNFNFMITDSSIAKTGKIFSTTTSGFMNVWVSNLTNKFTMKVDNGIIENDNRFGRFFFFGNSTGTNDPNLDILFENTKFYGKNGLVSIQAFNPAKVKITLNNFEFHNDPDGTSTYLYGESSKLSELFDSTKNDLYIDDVLHTNLDDDANITATKSFKIKSKIALTLDSITIPEKDFGYGESSYKLKFNNNTVEPLTISTITLSNDTNFELVGSLPLTIPANSSDDTLEIKIKAGANAGSYYTNLIVKDGNDQLYYPEPISIKVNKVDIYPTIGISSWIYGETKGSPIISNNPSDGIVTLDYIGVGGKITHEVPDKPGSYTLALNVGVGTNHLPCRVTTTFTIYKKAVYLTSLSIPSRPFKYNSMDLTADQINYTLGVDGISSIYGIIPNTGLFVGTKLIKVQIMIDSEWQDYYDVPNDSDGYATSVAYEKTVPYEITTSTMDFILTNTNNGDSSTTTLFVKRGDSIDLANYFDLSENYFKDDVDYSIIGDTTGLSLSGSTLTTASIANLGIVTIKLYSPMVDLNDDTVAEYSENSTNIYIKIVDKEEVTLSGLTDNVVFIYDGSSKKPSGTITVQDDKVAVSELEVTYNGIDGTTYNSVNAPINAGKYTVTYKVLDLNPNYYGSVTYNFTINKANPTYTVPTGLTGVKNDILETITLPTEFVWKNPYAVMTDAGNKTFLARYIPTDVNNYNTIEDIVIAVYVKDKFDITTNSLGNGTITPSTTGVLEGTLVEVTVTPNTGYVVDELKVNGVKTSITNNILSIKVLEDLTIEVSFKKQQFSIDITGTNLDGLNITPSSSTYVDYGTDKDITIEVKDGYKILSIKVNGEDKELIDNKLSLTNITVNYVIEIKVEELKKDTAPEETEKPTVTLQEPYRVIEGANQEVIAGGKVDAKFKINADYSLFMAVYVNNKLLDPSNYIVENGSTIVILKQSYLNTLEEGKYTLKVVFKDSKEVQTGFTVSKEKVEENVDSKDTKETKEKTEDTKEETTENKFNLWYLIAALVIVGIIIIIYRRKKEEK